MYATCISPIERTKSPFLINFMLATPNIDDGIVLKIVSVKGDTFSAVIPVKFILIGELGVKKVKKM